MDERAQRRLDVSEEEVQIKSVSKLSVLENQCELNKETPRHDARMSYRMSQHDLRTSRE